MGTIHISHQQASKETVADVNADVQCEWALTNKHATWAATIGNKTVHMTGIPPTTQIQYHRWDVSR